MHLSHAAVLCRLSSSLYAATGAPDLDHHILRIAAYLLVPFSDLSSLVPTRFS